MKKIILIYLSLCICLLVGTVGVAFVNADVYGYVMKLINIDQIGKGYVRDSEGNVHETGVDNSELALKMATQIAQLQAELPAYKIIVAPVLNKNIPGTQFSQSIVDDNVAMDVFVNTLKDNKIKTLDYREEVKETFFSVKNLFYKTDSKWKVETAFWAYKEVIDYYEKLLKVDLDKTDQVIKEENFALQTYPNAYAGPYTKDLGKYYVGVDDYTLIVPTFASEFDVTRNGVTSSGNFVDMFLDLTVLKNEEDKTKTYLNKIDSTSEIKNLKIGNDQKLLVIKDQESDPLIAFLALAFSNVHVIDIETNKLDLVTYIKTYDPNAVFISISDENFGASLIKK